MLNIIVCDDDALHRCEIIKCVQNALGAVRADISDFHAPAQLLQHLRETGFQPHIALLDICMPEQDGISLARDLKEYAPSCQIIFLSSYLSYTTEVYEVEHIYFILKSQLQQRIGAALHRALAALGDSTAQIAVEKDKITRRIALQDVLYLERNLRKTVIYTAQDVFLSQKTPQTICGASVSFTRCHQSYWVNLDHVQAMGDHKFTIDNGASVPISRTYSQSAKRQFLQRLVHA